MTYQIKKKHSSEENQQRYRPLLQSKEGEIKKSKRLWGIELANSFRYFSNNKKQKAV